MVRHCPATAARHACPLHAPTRRALEGHQQRHRQAPPRWQLAHPAFVSCRAPGSLGDGRHDQSLPLGVGSPPTRWFTGASRDPRLPVTPPFPDGSGRAGGCSPCSSITSTIRWARFISLGASSRSLRKVTTRRWKPAPRAGTSCSQHRPWLDCFWGALLRATKGIRRARGLPSSTRAGVPKATAFAQRFSNANCLSPSRRSGKPARHQPRHGAVILRAAMKAEEW